MIALIPSRAGSKRVPGKATRLLNGHPVIAYTITAALASEVFEAIYVCTDDPYAKRIATDCGVAVWARQPIADAQPDIEWVSEFRKAKNDAFAILRPTSPFRSADHIRAAYQRFTQLGQSIDSLRAVRPVMEHPGKMWELGLGISMFPAVVGVFNGTPYHSMPTQSLPKFYVQTSSLEMAWTRVLHDDPPTISGSRIAPWILESDDPNGFSIDTERDWAEAVRLAGADPALLPSVAVAAVSASPQTD